MTRSEEVSRTRYVDGVEVPTFLYGTAWKEERTESLVGQALQEGFRGIDTANQRRHYHEAGVGDALRDRLEAEQLDRDDVFLQSKFTHLGSQDDRLPYDPDADLTTQVRQSFDSSLEHLGVEALDSYLLHGPRTRFGIGAADREVWRAMEQLKGSGRTRLIGVSNVSASQLETLCELAETPPAFVQNRCFARAGWDRDVRRVCREREILYQGFSLLTANRAELASPRLREIAARNDVTLPQVVFRFALQSGMICLTGTTDPEHMRQDLAVYDLELSGAEVEAIEGISG